jgi:hypothetical protein
MLPRNLKKERKHTQKQEAVATNTRAAFKTKYICDTAES